MSAPLSDEDAAARERLIAHLRSLAPEAYQCEVAVEEEDDAGFHVLARLRSSGDGEDHDSLVVRSTRATAGAALCEAARRIGFAL